MRADRLLSLMLLLQSKGHMTAQDLARELEVSERTIYRDIEALSFAGIPVYTQPGTNGGVFMDEDYRIALTGLSQSEIQSLFISSSTGLLKDLGLEKSVDASLLKLFATLPSTHRDAVERMRQRIYIDPVSWFDAGEPMPVLPTLQQAVWEDRELDIVYQRRDGVVSEQTVQAYALVAKSSLWYLVAKQANGEMRMFRVSRIKAVTLSPQRFARDPEFDLVSHWEAVSQAFEQQLHVDQTSCQLTARIQPDYLWILSTSLGVRFERLDKPDPEGWVIIQATFLSLMTALMSVLQLGTHIEVLDPPDLRNQVIDIVQAVLDFYQVRNIN